jgi:hypothetical protein
MCGPSDATHAMHNSAAEMPFFSAITFNASTNAMFRFMFCKQYQDDWLRASGK